MPLFQYFGWVGSFLLATLVAANWCLSAPIAPPSDVPLDQKIHIRIHTDHEWPERVVLDTTRAALAKADGDADVGESRTPVMVERQPFDAEMAPIAARCFRAPCSTQAAEAGALAIE